MTSRGLIWAYVGKPIDSNTICVMPEQAQTTNNDTCIYTDEELKNCYGICSDFISMYRTQFSGLSPI